MLDFVQFLVAPAMAQTPPDQAAPAGALMGGGGSSLPIFIVMGLIFAVFYFIVIMPQNKKFDALAKMQKGLQRGDRVVTVGGIHGKVAKLEGDEHLMVEIADGVIVKIARVHIQSLAAKTQPITTADGDDAEKKS